MTTLSEAFDHLVYWWDRLTGRTVVPVPWALLGVDPISDQPFEVDSGESFLSDADVPPAGES